jgi:transposase
VTTNQKGQSYYHLVESYRDDGKVKQRTIASLGRVEDGKLEELQSALSKYLDTVTITSLAKHIDISKAYVLGPLLILERMFERLGITNALKQIQDSHEKLSIDLHKTVFTMVASRFIKPVSKLGLYDRWLEKMYPEMIDHNIQLHHFYRTLNILYQDKDFLENYLYSHKRDLFDMQLDVVLYDLTTLRFESTVKIPGALRQFGYSKERRSDCTQVVFGLLTDTNGIPLGFEVYPGNTFEGQTLSGIVEKMKKKFHIKRFIFVADRGLFSEPNLQMLEQEGGEYIVGMRMGKIPQQEVQKFYDTSNYRFINEKLAVYETSYKGRRMVVTWSDARARRDRKSREEVVEKLKNKLSVQKPKIKHLITHQGYKKYLKITGDNGQISINEQIINEEAKKDGFFAIITNVPVKDLRADELVMQYKQLWRIEDAFGEFKGTIQSRPVFHWTDERITGHLMICFLSVLCEAYLNNMLHEQNERYYTKSTEKKIIEARPLTAHRAMEELCQVMAIPVDVNGKRIWVRTDIPPNALKLFKAIGMKIPAKILNQNQNVVAQTV